jgi:integrase
MATAPKRKGSFWYYSRRVPTAVAHLDKRRIVHASTYVRIADDPRGIAAARVIEKMDAEAEAHWKALLGGVAPDEATRFDTVRSLAGHRGLAYTPAEELGRPDKIDDLVSRLETLAIERRVDNEVEVAAALGGEKPPVLKASGLFAAYEKIMEATLVDMSPDQRRKWPDPYRKALAIFLEVVGDKPLADITRNDALDFRAHWQKRIVNREVKIYTANRSIGSINRMMNTVIKTDRLPFSSQFEDLRFEGQHRQEEQRVAFAPAFIQDDLFDGEALAGLNDQARHIFYLCAETGLRLSEAANLTKDTILLDCNVPHIQVRAQDRRLKAKASRRDIPLVGAALEVMKLNPEGFPRYRDKTASLSATIGKYLEENDLRPTAKETAYSLRHAFEDRLNAVEAPEKMVGILMGHNLRRPRYGEGFALSHVQSWLNKIAFRPPPIL